MSRSIDGLVETSLNLGIMELKEDALPRKLEELGIDSLNTIFLLCEFEKSQLFRIDLEQLSTMRLETVQSLVDLIYTYQKKL